jgi:hypothetical protein
MLEGYSYMSFSRGDSAMALPHTTGRRLFLRPKDTGIANGIMIAVLITHYRFAILFVITLRGISRSILIVYF